MIAESFTNAEEFEGVCHAFGPCELVRGRPVRLSPVEWSQAAICTEVGCTLESWAQATGRGRVLLGGVGVVVERDPDTVRAIDAAYCSYERIPRGSGPEGFLTTAPDLAVEIVDTVQGWADMLGKSGEYLRMSVDRVWVIDPRTRRVHVFRADAEPAVYSEQDALTDETILPGFSCKVADFFKD